MNDLTLDEIKKSHELKEISENTVIISNIVDVTSNVIKQLANETISNSINDDKLSSNMLSLIVINKIKNKLNQQGV